MKQLSIDNGVNVNPLWTDRITIALYPVATQVTNVSAAAAPTGSTTYLKAGTYYYVVTAIGANGEGVASTEVNATATSTNNEITLTFDAQTDIYEYRVYRGTVTGKYNEVFVCKDAGTYVDNGSQIAVESYDSWSASKTYYKDDLVVGTNNIVYKSVATSINKNPVSGMGYWVVVKNLIGTITPSIVYDIIRKKDIVAVHPIFLPEIIIDGEVKPLISKISLEKTCGGMYYIDLTRVANQATWNLGTFAATNQAAQDINGWLV